MAQPFKKMKQGMTYSRKEKTIILNVFKYFQVEFPEKGTTDLVRRTSRATGCSEKSIFQFRKEETSSDGLKEPSRTKTRKNININSRDIKYDDSVRQALRDLVYELKGRNINPSLMTISKFAADNTSIPKFSLMTLRRLLYDMGFYYEREGNKSVLVEKDEKRYNPKKCEVEAKDSVANSFNNQPVNYNVKKTDNNCQNVTVNVNSSEMHMQNQVFLPIYMPHGASHSHPAMEHNARFGPPPLSTAPSSWMHHNNMQPHMTN